jgi:hypothetical protein
MAYLTERRHATRARLASAVDELLLLAAREHGKELAHRASVEVATAPDGPTWDVTEHGTTITLESYAVEHDFRGQVIYQAAHEAAHVALTDADAGTWIDEMLATRFAVRVMEAVDPEYARQTIRSLLAEAELMTPREMRRVQLGDDEYPGGFYGRAFVTGQHLEGRLGWTALRRLARPGQPAGTSDLTSWFEQLDELQRRSVVVALGAGPVRAGRPRRLLAGG